jgi:hypothetical protein
MRRNEGESEVPMVNRELPYSANWFADKCGHRRLVCRWPTLLLLAVTLICAGCGDPVVVLNISAPASVVAGTPFAITVTVTANGSRDKIFNSPVTFSSSDAAGTVPSYYTFAAADAGSHTFPGFVLMTVGTQTIKATDYLAPSVNGSATITVTSADSANAE